MEETVISIENLIQNKVHFGHIKTKRHPKMNEFLYGISNGAHIIDPRITLTQLKKACDYAFEMGKNGKRILYVGSKKSAAQVIKDNADRSGNFYVNFRWLGGTLTNFQTIRQSMTKLTHIENIAKEDFSYPDIIKKEASKLEKERKKMVRVLGGFRNMKKNPGALFVVDANRERIAIKEARLIGLPVVALVDSDVNPLLIDYIIPCNDDLESSIKILTNAFTEYYIAGRKIFETQKKSETKVAEKAKAPSANKSSGIVNLTAKAGGEKPKLSETNTKKSDQKMAAKLGSTEENPAEQSAEIITDEGPEEEN